MVVEVLPIVAVIAVAIVVLSIRIWGWQIVNTILAIVVIVELIAVVTIYIITYNTNWQTKSNIASVFVLIVAAVGAIIGFYYYMQNTRWNIFKYLADLYYDALKTGLNCPDFLDPMKTQKYDEEWACNSEMYAKYNAYARMCWAHAEDIYAAIFKDYFRKLYAPTFERYYTLHSAWFQKNTSTFLLPGFVEFIKLNKWRNYLNKREAERLLWDNVVYDYDEKILNPMKVEKDNPMLQYLNNLSKIQKEGLIVADIGCGTGSFVARLAKLKPEGLFKKIYGIDYSDNMIEIARKKCKYFKKNVEILKIDMTDLTPLRVKLEQEQYGKKEDDKLDRIFSINSILPRDPNDTPKMLKQIAKTLKSNGEFVAILPSFDTVEYLKHLEFIKFRTSRGKNKENLLYRDYPKFFYYYLKFWWRMNSEDRKSMLKFWDRIESGARLDTWKLFYQDKKMNVRDKLYADDGVNIQRFIHKNEIEPLFKRVGLRLIEKHLFSWNDIPGSDDGILIDFIVTYFDADWEKTKKDIKKTDKDRIIEVLAEKNTISLRLNRSKTKVALIIDGLRTDEFIVKEENEKLNICLTAEKLYYPWELTKKFKYGYFPGREKIWDWFVVAEKTTKKS